MHAGYCVARLSSLGSPAAGLRCRRSRCAYMSRPAEWVVDRGYSRRRSVVIDCVRSKVTKFHGTLWQIRRPVLSTILRWFRASPTRLRSRHRTTCCVVSGLTSTRLDKNTKHSLTLCVASAWMSSSCRVTKNTRTGCSSTMWPL